MHQYWVKNCPRHSTQVFNIRKCIIKDPVWMGSKDFDGKEYLTNSILSTDDGKWNNVYNLLLGNRMNVIMKRIGSLINNSNSEVRLKVLHAVTELIHIPGALVSISVKYVRNCTHNFFCLVCLVRRWRTSGYSWRMVNHVESKTYSIDDEFDETAF